jgi:hypothetical protein
MNGIKKWLILGVAFLLITNGLFYAARADHDEHKKKRWSQKIFDWDNDEDNNDHNRGKKRRRYQKRNRNDFKHYGKRYLAPVNNPAYIEECGDCHFAYQPELLPSGSWEKIIAGLDDHFGEELEIDTESKNVILGYLNANSAEKSSAKRAVKIMRSLGNRPPMRITEIPYILEKHDEVDPDVFKKESIDSLSNCRACHTTAEKGIYEDDHVRIPK